MFADLRIETALATAGGLGLRIAAVHAVHVCRWPADIGYRTAKLRVTAQAIQLILHRFLGARLDRLALVVGNSAEGATATATTVAGDGELDLPISRNRFEVRWMRQL